MQEDIYLMDDRKVVKEVSNSLNTFSSTPILDQSALKLKQGDFLTHPCVTITSRDFKLDFSFQPVRVSYIETLLGKSSATNLVELTK